MEQKKIDQAVRYVLRYAKDHNGVVSYNPCMYNLGCADNIPPIEDFNNELRKYGDLHYDEYIMEEYGYCAYNTWDYFQIDERGRSI